MTNPSTPNQPTELPGDLNEALSERCIEYLMGELTADECLLFEESLAESSELRDELARQAEIICQISAIKDGGIVSHAPVQTTRWLGVLAVLAACLLVAYVGFQVTSEVDPQLPSEDVLIAQAWAETESLTAANGLDLETTVDWGLEPQDESQDLIDDTSLSWLMSAVEIEGDSIDG